MRILLLTLLTLSLSLHSKDIESLKVNAEKGNVKAQAELAKIYQYGKGVDADINKAIFWLEKAAQQKDEQSILTLAGLYNFGLSGIEIDYSKAVFWWSKGAEIESTPAQSFLGNAYFFGRGVEKDITKGIEYWTIAAKKEQYVAQFYLAEINFYGNGTKKDYSKAFYWYKKSTENGYYKAIANLAVCYFNGLGVEKDPIMARDLLEIAIGKNEENAQKVWKDLKIDELKFDEKSKVKKHIDIFDRNFIQSLNVMDILKQAQNGDAKAQSTIAGCYLYGHGVEKNVQTAISWLEKAIEQKHLKSNLGLGILLLEGKYIDKNEKRAFTLIKDAADEGESRSKLILFGLYLRGFGVDRNVEEAKKWLVLAAEDNDVLALMTLSNHYKKGSLGFKKNPIQAEILMKRASYSGHPKALYGYGMFFLPYNYPKAIKYLTLAAEKKHPDAAYFLSVAYLNGMFQVKQDKNLGLKYLKQAAEKGHKKAKEDLKKMELEGI